MSDTGEQAASESSMILDLPPSCLEFCPAFPSCFLVGTYFLEKNDASVPTDVDSAESSRDEIGNDSQKSQRRNGSIVVYQLVGKVMYVQETSYDFCRLYLTN